MDVSLLCEFCCVFATLNQIYKTNMTLSLFKGFVWFIIKWGILQICQRQITLVWFTKQLCLYLGTEQRKFESQRENWPLEKTFFTAFMEILPSKIKSNLFKNKLTKARKTRKSQGMLRVKKVWAKIFWSIF